MPQTVHLVLVRHGHPVDVDDTWSVNPPLSERGRHQAMRVAERLARESIDAVISSPLKRALETARIHAERTGAEVRTMDGVAELDHFGGRYMTMELLRQRGEFEAFLRDPIGLLGGNEETFRAGIMDALERIIVSHPGGKVAIFTHGLPINAILSRILGLPELTRFMPFYCSLTRILALDPERMTILSVNDTGHFDPSEM